MKESQDISLINLSVPTVEEVARMIILISRILLLRKSQNDKKAEEKNSDSNSKVSKYIRTCYRGEDPPVDELLSFSTKQKYSRDETKRQRTQEIAVDASLSTWLTTSPTSGCSSISMGAETAMSDKQITPKQYGSKDHCFSNGPVCFAKNRLIRTTIIGCRPIKLLRKADVGWTVSLLIYLSLLCSNAAGESIPKHSPPAGGSRRAMVFLLFLTQANSSLLFEICVHSPSKAP
ncbi:hypothetical protein YC2023_115742 [Brassica napus]